MPDLCGDKKRKRKGEKKKWVGQAHTVEKVGGPLAHMAHTVPPPVAVIDVKNTLSVKRNLSLLQG